MQHGFVLFTGVLQHFFTRHITVDTAISIIAAAAVSAAMLLALIIFTGLQIPRSVPFIHAAFSVVSIASIRFFIRAIGQNIDVM